MRGAGDKVEQGLSCLPEIIWGEKSRGGRIGVLGTTKGAYDMRWAGIQQGGSLRVRRPRADVRIYAVHCGEAQNARLILLGVVHRLPPSVAAWRCRGYQGSCHCLGTRFCERTRMRELFPVWCGGAAGRASRGRAKRQFDRKLSQKLMAPQARLTLAGRPSSVAG